MDRRLRRMAPVVLVALVATGCFTYRPATVDRLEPGTTVRTLLTPQQVVELDGVVTVRERRLTGTVVQATDDRLLLDIRVASTGEGALARPLNQRIALPAAAVVDVEERVLDRWKTALVVGGVAAIVGGFVAWQIVEGDNSPVGDPKDPPDASRIPGIRITIPLPGG